ncbi:MAG TPA: rod shape-determining protein MreD [Candidatus Paenibacillus intestinavium]|nr:rod shape-determining protein MreD [Candidatus Paenibacillus intestinavium]
MSMNRIVLIMLIVFVLEGALMPWIIPNSYGDRIIPHFTFVMVIFASMYGGRHQALALGMGFGLLQDIMYYGHVMGTHFFFMGLIGYLSGILLERKKATIMLAISTIGFATIGYDSALYFVNKVFKLTTGSYPWALIQYILPSLFLQLVFSLCIYIPVRKMFELGKQRRSSDSAEEL